jgi:hypothetical protein
MERNSWTADQQVTYYIIAVSKSMFSSIIADTINTAAGRSLLVTAFIFSGKSGASY